MRGNKACRFITCLTRWLTSFCSYCVDSRLENILWKGNILVGGRDGKTDVEAFQFYIVIRPEGMKCPKVVCLAPVEIDSLFLCAYKHIFLHSAAGPVIGKLFSSALGFSMRGKHFGNDPRGREDIV